MCPSGLRLRPCGSGVSSTAHVYGSVPPLAVSWASYGRPRTARGRSPGPTASGGYAILIVYCFAELTAPDEAFSVNVNSPCFVGVPVICPPESESPSGSWRATVQATSPGAPVTASVCVKGTPVTPSASAAGMVSRTATVYVRAAAFAPGAVACTVNVYVPAVVGVPLSCPAGVSVSPGGSVPVVTANEGGPVPPVAASAWVYG